MLYIVARYHCMQFQGKPMNQSWENGKKPSFGPAFCLFLCIFGPQKVFLWILTLLDVLHCGKLSLCEISGKTNEPKKLRKWQKTYFQSRFCPIWPKFELAKVSFNNLVSSVTRYHGQLSPCAISEKYNDLILRKLSDGRTDGRTRVIS